MLTIPPWKAELMSRKRLDKAKTELVPEWKKDLLKRLHAKAEAARLKMEEDTANQDKAVLNEHIMRVSDNIFVRQESTKKLTMGHQAPLKSPLVEDNLLDGYRVTRSNNVVIIEKDEISDESVKGKPDEVDVEMPVSGTVSRLKDKFVEHRSDYRRNENGYRRSKSSDNVFDQVAGESIANTPPSVATDQVLHDPPYPRTYSLPGKPAPSQQSGTRKRKDDHGSINFFTPKSFTSKPEESNAKVTSPTRKVTPPSFHPRKHPVSEANIAASKFVKSKPNDSRGKVTAPTRKVKPPVLSSEGFTSSDTNTSTFNHPPVQTSTPPPKQPNEPSAKPSPPEKPNAAKAVAIEQTAAKPEVIAIPNTYHGYISKAKDVLSPVEKSPPDARFASVPPEPRQRQHAPDHVVKRVAPVVSLEKVKESSAVPPKPVKETARRQPASVKVDASRGVKDRTKASAETSNGAFQVVDLGKTSMDPSLLKSKGAIAANEIMKESKTIKIIPKARNGPKNVAPSVATSKPVAKQDSAKILSEAAGKEKSYVSDRSVDSKSTVSSGILANAANEVVKLSVNESASPPVANRSAPNQQKKMNGVLPVSSVDDVIVKRSAASRPSEKIERREPKTDKAKPSHTAPSLNGINADSKPNDRVKSPISKSAPKSDVVNKTTPLVVNKTTPPVVNKTTPPVVNKTTPPVVNKTTPPVVNRVSPPSAQSIFGTKSNSGGFGGGRSFVIDPSKFKKSSAAPAATSNATNQKTNVASVTSSGRVITPKAQNSAAAATTEVDGMESRPKGKRKLTVDQIQVVGGYVKLERSCLSKVKHKHKGVHVSFDQSHLESVFEYPSEKSLLSENGDASVMQKPAPLAKLPGSGKDSQLGKYTPKYLLAMKESLSVDDDDDDDDDAAAKPSPAQAKAKIVGTTPLGDGEDFSSSSADLLF